MAVLLKRSEYRDWLLDLKQQIKTSQIKAALSVNSQMIMLYWDLGRQIVEKQETAKWGSGFIEQLSKDLCEEFPEMTGFSLRNLRFIKQWHLFYSQIDLPIVKQVVSQLPQTTNTQKSEQVVPNLKNQIVAQVVRQFENSTPAISEQLVQKLKQPDNQDNAIVAQLVPQLKVKQLVSQLILIPWGHHIKILQKIKDPRHALFYVNKTIENNWSRAVLEYQIETKLHARQGKAVTNFNLTLPAPQSDLANELMKDPYHFDFIRASEKLKEAELEKALVQHISQFLPELGIGFAYMGRQFALKVGTKEYRTDLLFYHTRLKCHVIIELKTTDFIPEFVGKLNFYITAVNELIKDTRDNPTIGMLLCKNKDNYDVEFSLKDVNNPIGVSTFHYADLADDMKAALPPADKLQNELITFEREHARG